MNLHPVLTLKPNRCQLFTGESVTFVCDVGEERSTNLLYRFNVNDGEFLTWSSHNRYTLQPVATGHSGVYQCELYPSYKKSNKVSLTVSDHNLILESPPFAVFLGESVTLRCWDHSWTKVSATFYKDGSQESLRTSEATTELTINSVSKSDEGFYKCKRSHDESKETMLKVEEKPKAKLTSDRGEIPESGTVTLTCSVEVSEGWKYYWYRNVTRRSEEVVEGGASLHYRSVRVSQGGLYWCEGGRGDPVYYTHSSDPISLDKIVSTRPVVTQQPNWPHIFSGESVTLQCEIHGGRNTQWEYEWTTSSSSTPLNQAVHRISRASSSNSGGYRCRGRKTLEYSSTAWSNYFQLTVSSSKPQPTLKADKEAIPVGGKVILTCNVPESSGWKYYWYRNKKDSNPLAAKGGVPYSGSQISISEGGQYWCRGGRGDSVYYTEYTSITIHNAHKPEPKLTVSPSWLSPGASVTLNCGVEYPSAGWRFYWYKAVPQLSSSSYTYELLPDREAGTAEGSYVIHGLTHTAGFMCQAGRGDPVVYTKNSTTKFVWSGDRRPSASVTVSPNRTQHFRYEYVTLTCAGNSIHGKMKRFFEGKIKTLSWRALSIL
ncbi:Fc receptor-like protein 4 [Myripristis murdjan]|uniref:Fc receptor-like protein 4 n=1 Tax=Myripristis murdjan TaxID=586833 RepID=UPI001175E490|nr:Fc receptor-like protein 4 [Myripristis murdjan]